MSRVAPLLSTRRAFLIGGTALLGATAFAGPAFANVSTFLDRAWAAAKSRGVPRKVFDVALGDFSPLDSVIKLTKKQPEHASTAADYVSKRVTDDKASTGQGLRKEWAQTLAEVSSQYEVQPEAVLAIWGIETNFGTFKGKTPTIPALATLVYSGYRSSYFQEEMLVALEILAAGHVKPADMVGSWAGAMGHPQFMPTSFMRFAVDFKGDGHKDIWNSVPDAMASTANYLTAHGWQPGQTWGYEVRLPSGFNYAQVWNGTRQSLGDWADLGVKRANGKPFPRASDTARVYMPMGGHGPVFLVLPNFDVIKRYNSADLYALAVGHLADRVIGAKDFVSSWPNDTALDSSGRKQVQSLLLRKGYGIGTADGVIGGKTRAAVMDWQRRAGLLPDGHVGGKLLQQLSA